MNRLDLIRRVRSLTRDLSNSIFREIDIIDYINESIDRYRQYIPELAGMKYLTSGADKPDLLPEQYHYLIAVYAASRCFGQDERHYQATNFMNEFEIKLEEMKSKLEAGEVVITDPQTGEAVGATYEPDYVVTNNYYFNNSSQIDFDEGVEGVK